MNGENSRKEVLERTLGGNGGEDERKRHRRGGKLAMEKLTRLRKESIGKKKRTKSK